MNQTSILHIILQGDAVTIISAILLLLMSIMTWAIFIRQYHRLYLLQKHLPSFLQNHLQAQQAQTSISYAPHLQEKISDLNPIIATEESFHINSKINQPSQTQTFTQDSLTQTKKKQIERILNITQTSHSKADAKANANANAILSEMSSAIGRPSKDTHIDGLSWLDFEHLNPISQRLLSQKIHNQLHQGFNTLATITSMAPFIGLLGTVWGIYHALGKLALSSQTLQIQQLAGPVSEALIMTAFGLVVALPSLLAFNILNKKSKPLWQLFQTYWQHA